MTAGVGAAKEPKRRLKNEMVGGAKQMKPAGYAVSSAFNSGGNKGMYSNRRERLRASGNRKIRTMMSCDDGLCHPEGRDLLVSLSIRR